MATPRLAQHLPSLFGPSRRAAWRLSVLRRLLAAAALLLAIHLALGLLRPAAPASSGPAQAADPGGATLTLTLAAPVGDLEPGDEVSVYVPGRARPVATTAELVGATGASEPEPTARVALPPDDVGELVQEMGSDQGGRRGFVLVREG